MNVHDGEFVDNGLAYLDQSQAAVLNHVTLHAGDVLLNITGASVARVCALPDRLSGGRVNQHVAIIRPDSKTLHTNFLAHLLRAPEAKARLLRVAGAGATREAITKAQIEEFRIPVPPLGEQRRIASILDKADTLRRKRERAADLLNSLTHSIFRTLGRSSEWPRVRFEDAVFFQEGPGVRNWQFRDSGVKLVNVKNIVNGNLVINNSNRFLSEDEVSSRYRHFLLEAGDFVLASSGVTWGKIAEVKATDLPLCLNTSMIRIRARAPFTKAYVRSFIEFGDFRSQIDRLITGSAQPNFGPSHLKQILIPKLPEEVQLIIERIRNRIETVEHDSSKMMSATEVLFSSLQHRAFSGQL